MASGRAVSLAAAGASQNAHGRIYQPGRSYGIGVKLEVADTCERMANMNENGRMPSGRALANEASVSLVFAQKVIGELETHGRVLAPEEMVSDRLRGVGIIALDDRDEWLLLYLRFLDPSRTNANYCKCLLMHHGKLVSESLISD
jgi:hypothetical protein